MKGEVIDDIRALEKGLTQVTTQMTTMVSVVNELKNTSTIMSEAIQIIARKEVTVEHHSESIKTLFDKAEKNEEDIKKLNSSIYESCNLKTKEIEKKGEAVKTELKPEIAKTEKNGVGRFVVAMLAITTVFSYFYYDMKDVKKDVREEIEKVEKEVKEERLSVINKLDNILDVVNSMAIQVKSNSINTKHNKELLEQNKHIHNRNK